MIFIEDTFGKDMELWGWLCKSQGSVIQLPTIADKVGFCICKFMCDYIEKVSVFPDDPNNEYKNDYKSLITTLVDPQGSIDFVLVDSNLVEYPLDDATYGTYFPLGFNSLAPYQSGYKVDWLKVYNLLGAGFYTLKINQTNYGQTTTYESYKFHVMVYNERRLNFTVKLEIISNGETLNGLDYTNINWKNMYRIDGTFGNEEPQYEIDRLVDANRRDINVQTSKHNNYTLETQLIPLEVAEWLLNEMNLTDQIFISVNDVFNFNQYRQIPVTFEGSVTAGSDYSRNNRKRYTVTLKDKALTLRRNFV